MVHSRRDPDESSLPHTVSTVGMLHVAHGNDVATGIYLITVLAILEIGQSTLCTALARPHRPVRDLLLTKRGRLDVAARTEALTIYHATWASTVVVV